MQPSSLKTLGWMALYLVLIEIAQEYRAWTRGWDTLVLSHWKLSRAVAAPTPAPGSDAQHRFGPTSGFPFRSRVVDETKRDGVPRIWLASSSHAEDSFLSAGEIFPTKVQDHLAARGEPVEMLNASRAGESMAGHLARAAAQASTWQPDIVLLYQMSNDIALQSRKAAAGNTEATSDVLGAAQGLSWNWADRVLEQSSTWPLLKTNITSVLTSQRLLRDELEDEAERSYEDEVRAFIRLWKQRGARVVLCTFATSHDERNAAEMPLETKKTIFRHNMHLSIAGWTGTVKRWNGVLRRLAAEEQAELIDVERAIGGRSDLFRDFVHFTANGHTEVAKIIARELRL